MERDMATASEQGEAIAGRRETWEGNGHHGWRGCQETIIWDCPANRHPKAPEPREGRDLTLEEILEGNGGGCYFRQQGQEPPSNKLTFEQRPVKMREQVMKIPKESKFQTRKSSSAKTLG